MQHVDVYHNKPRMRTWKIGPGMGDDVEQVLALQRRRSIGRRARITHLRSESRVASDLLSLGLNSSGDGNVSEFHWIPT